MSLKESLSESAALKIYHKHDLIHNISHIQKMDDREWIVM